jgi:putative ABC transport system substrate-binding protein
VDKLSVKELACSDFEVESTVGGLHSPLSWSSDHCGAWGDRMGDFGMRRRNLLTAAAAIAAAGPAYAERFTRPVRVGFLSPSRATDFDLEHFRLGMSRIGWAEGRDYIVKARFSNMEVDRLPSLLDQLLLDGIDVLIAYGAATRMVTVAQRSVPVVFSFSGDPVAAGYVRSMARPGGNATGNSQLMWDLVGKRLQLLRDVAPNARRTLVVQSPDHPGEQEERSRTQGIGLQLGFETMIRPVRDRVGLEIALAEGAAAGCDSMLCFTDAVTVANRHIIADHARHMRVPAVFPRREFCEVGGLISYGPSIPHLIWHLAMFVERIADGMRAGDIPVEWPTVIETVVNKRTADAIGITLPVVVLARADEVIE